MLLYLTIFLLALSLSFYFSGSEAGYISFNKEKFANDVELKNKKALKIKKYLENTGLVLALTLLGNNFFNIIAVTTFDKLWSIWFIDNLEYFLLVSTVIILIFGEILPKIIFRQWSRFLLYETSKIILLFNKIFAPVISVIIKITSFFLDKQKIQSREKLSKEDFLYLIEKEFQEGSVKDIERNIVKNISLFYSLSLKELMFPLIDLFLVPIDQNLNSIRESINKEKIDLILVYEKRIDNLVGYVTSLEIFQSSKKNLLAKDVLHECLYIPESVSIDKVYDLLIEKGNELAVIVNEQGGSLGVVKREDVINEVFGVRSKFSDRKDNVFIQKDNGHYKINASLEINDFNHYFNCKIKKDKFQTFQTLAGFLNFISEKIPQKDEVIEFEKFTFKILKANKNSVLEVGLKINKKT